MKSLTIVFPEPLKVELDLIEVPQINPGSILVKSIVSHISTGTELTCYRGIFDTGTNWAEWVKYPFNPGYSVVGEVVEVGHDVKKYKRNDIVYLMKPHSQYHVINLNDAKIESKDIEPIVLPPEISPDHAVCASLAEIAAAGVRRAKIEFGERVVVIGAGPVGQMVAQFAYISGASRIIVIDTVQLRLDCAKKFGATDTLKMRAEEACEAVQDLLLGEQPEVVFDATGHYSVLAEACKIVRRNGRVILAGDCSTPSKQSIGPAMFKSIDILGAHAQRYMEVESLPWSSMRHKEMIFDFMQRGRLMIEHLISHRYSPMEARELYSRLLDDRSFSMDILFDWNHI